MGIHATVWKELTNKRFAPPKGKPLTVASYVALGANTFTTHMEPLAVGDRLPDIPLFLSDEFFVETPLEETYQIAWLGFPSPLRAVVEGSLAPLQIFRHDSPDATAIRVEFLRFPFWVRRCHGATQPRFMVPWHLGTLAPCRGSKSYHLFSTVRTLSITARSTCFDTPKHSKYAFK